MNVEKTSNWSVRLHSDPTGQNPRPDRANLTAAPPYNQLSMPIGIYSRTARGQRYGRKNHAEEEENIQHYRTMKTAIRTQPRVDADDNNLQLLGHPTSHLKQTSNTPLQAPQLMPENPIEKWGKAQKTHTTAAVEPASNWLDKTRV